MATDPFLLCFVKKPCILEAKEDQIMALCEIKEGVQLYYEEYGTGDRYLPDDCSASQTAALQNPSADH